MLTFNFIIRRLAAASHASSPPPITITVFSMLAISPYRQPPLDVELLYDRGESCFDFVGIEPALVEVGEFFERRRFLAQKIFRKQPAIVGRHDLRADDGNRAPLVVLAHTFARARAANTATND